MALALKAGGAWYTYSAFNWDDRADQTGVGVCVCIIPEISDQDALKIAANGTSIGGYQLSNPASFEEIEYLRGAELEVHSNVSGNDSEAFGNLIIQDTRQSIAIVSGVICIIPDQLP